MGTRRQCHDTFKVLEEKDYKKHIKIQQSCSSKVKEVKTFQVNKNGDESLLADLSLKKLQGALRITVKDTQVHKNKQALVKATTQPDSRQYKCIFVCKSFLFLSDFKELHKAIITKPCYGLTIYKDVICRTKMAQRH